LAAVFPFGSARSFRPVRDDRARDFRAFFSTASLSPPRPIRPD